MKELNSIKGVGLTTIKALEELKIYNTYDLITHYPFRYNVIEKTDLNNLEDKQNVVIDGICENIPNVFFFSRTKNKMSFRLNVGTKVMNISIYNRGFLKNKIKVGIGLTVIGKYDKKTNSIVASDLRFGMITKTQIEPVYHASFKISSQKINKLIIPLLDDFDTSEFLPNYINEKYSFISKTEAI